MLVASFLGAARFTPRCYMGENIGIEGGDSTRSWRLSVVL